MKVIWTPAFVLLLSVPVTMAADLRITTEGKTEYLISVSSQATAVERTAAKELQEHLAQVTGVTLQIVDEDHMPPDVPRILVGRSRRLNRLLPDLDVRSLGHDDGIVMKTVGRNVVVVGRPPRGRCDPPARGRPNP